MSARAAVTTSVAAVERVVAIWAESRIVRRTYSTTELDVYAEVFDSDLDAVADRLESVLKMCSPGAQ